MSKRRATYVHTCMCVHFSHSVHLWYSKSDSSNVAKLNQMYCDAGEFIPANANEEFVSSSFTMNKIYHVNNKNILYEYKGTHKSNTISPST